MHIPDGFLDAKTWMSAAALSSVAVGYSIKKTRDSLGDRQAPALGVMAAFIFAAQMVNFPVGGGTSGHLLGAALATALLGPWGACLVLATVVIIQALFFADGGITVLGANILNMAVIAPLVSHLIYKFLGAGRPLAIFLGSWCSIFLSAIAVALQLALSGTIPLSVVLPAMAGWHALIGIGEGLITCAVYAFITRNGLLEPAVRYYGAEAKR
ncbi:energy-coupling factor ABC transporter permease [Thermosediminibacter oceani]|uniref:Cobalamin (Vitamin B12) biosynthesis CbiM protein n=1 Tax=Thermosediminibacter oceani (strain ATCC BAA-1034 / DSM 16646 / JW/IW-1228P) TaxID=555079 RepID=D9S1S9_THEOJ|nr:energy-coupling factor ABC transporter permease [Thermosediminibacter oceani]ADL07356.1 cobalamin (vitamin B12) biosynthesis CbiM protein [Thermosediminibacter oceani DSM 16646]